MEEVWKPVKSYECYSVSSLGRVRRGNRILQQCLNNSGYRVVGLCKYGIAKTFLVSRLLGQTFLERVPGKETIDHIDRCRTNNILTNLKWANHQEQMLNRNYPVGKTGQKNITQQDGKYKVQVKRNNQMLYAKLFPTLEEAIAARDAFISSYSAPPEILADVPGPLPSPS
jgi:hypothetical protein